MSTNQKLSSSIWLPAVLFIVIIALVFLVSKRARRSENPEQTQLASQSDSTTVKPGGQSQGNSKSNVPAEEDPGKAKTLLGDAKADPAQRLKKIMKSGARTPDGTLISQPIDPLLARAADFPHNLKTFDDWKSLTKEELDKYRRSLISRVGRWDAEGVEAFYYRVHDQLPNDEAKSSFRETILGVWCAKDVDGCLHSIETNHAPDLAIAAKREALRGWAKEDWMTAFSFLKKHGDQTIADRLGGDSTGFIENVAYWVAREAKPGEPENMLALLTTPENKDKAQPILRPRIEKEKEGTTNTTTTTK